MKASGRMTRWRDMERCFMPTVHWPTKVSGKKGVLMGMVEFSMTRLNN